ncbi:MAG TPA: glycosyltransferase family 4 protein [Bacteroidales bacterium]|nr:glycosyltransferase family 4 protein [Bacteroidales bacterium]HRX97973.1 glycosyltransferase family 4 protein [Bacteroidales bacterium]
MKILQICHKMPWPLHDGGAYSIYNNAVGLMRNGAEVKVFAMNTTRQWVDPDMLPSSFLINTSFESFEIDTRIRLVRVALNLLKSESYFVERFWSKKWNDKLIQILKNNTFDIIQLEHTYMGLYIETIRTHSSAKIVLRPQNAEFAAWERIVKNERSIIHRLILKIATKRLKKFESEVAQKVDGIIAISDRDQAIFKSLAPNKPVESIPVGYDFTDSKSAKESSILNEPPVFYHIGSMDWKPNPQGINWFIAEVLPLVLKSISDFKFRIAGKKMPASIKSARSNNIIIEGEVNDAAEFHLQNDIMIVPLLAGGGIRVKIIEAMALGKPVISTSIGAEGIPYKTGENILIADTPQQFVDQIRFCIKSPEEAKSIGQNGRRIIQEQFDLTNTTAEMIKFYEMEL